MKYLKLLFILFFVNFLFLFSLYSNLNANSEEIEIELDEENSISRELIQVLENPNIEFAYIPENIAENIRNLLKINYFEDDNQHFRDFSTLLNNSKNIISFDTANYAIQYLSQLIKKSPEILDKFDNKEEFINSIKEYENDLKSKDAIVKVQFFRGSKKCKVFCKLFVKDFLKVCQLCAKDAVICNLKVKGKFDANIDIQNCPSSEGIGVFQKKEGKTFFFRRIAAGRNIEITQDPAKCLIRINTDLKSCPGEGIELINDDQELKRVVAGPGVNITEVNNCDLVFSAFDGSGITNCQGDGVELFDPVTGEIKRLLAGDCINITEQPNECDIKIDLDLDNCTGDGVPLFDKPNCEIRRLLAGTGINIDDTDPCDITISADEAIAGKVLCFNSYNIHQQGQNNPNLLIGPGNNVLVTAWTMNIGSQGNPNELYLEFKIPDNSNVGVAGAKIEMDLHFIIHGIAAGDTTVDLDAKLLFLNKNATLAVKGQCFICSNAQCNNTNDFNNQTNLLVGTVLGTGGTNQFAPPAISGNELFCHYMVTVEFDASNPNLQSQDFALLRLINVAAGTPQQTGRHLALYAIEVRIP